ncbi:zinc finger FYVE domain-containing protein 9 isoform X1 [Solea senegalensis]|uniref:Zinc finger FYVE domain-containing protein 9 isoform X1 n=1 Tax=Solea senegalensis TaxID=28829 RepID=A0AAV6T753_SOLSE|nr:zinc finger FYVE domain-containing protein 9 isoform X2 [Solea senegalensis]KAG7525203.1 zinc finger FYVE domain-containing protein 9 isoform X1 [Solea senegalensis]
MENYFQAEAFNLDKVLDEFEQNEDETDTPILSDAKWTQILAPPAHLLSLNPALAHADLSPRESPLPFKALPDSSSCASPGDDPKRHPGPELSSWTEERPADVHSPPLPQPNIGKLVGTDDLSPPPVTACSAVENGCSASPPHDRLCKEISSPADNNPGAADQAVKPHQEERAVSAGGGSSTVPHTHFNFELGHGHGEALSEKVRPNVAPTTQDREDVALEDNAGVLQDYSRKRCIAKSNMDRGESLLNGGRDVQAGCEIEENGLSPPNRVGVEKERSYNPEEHINQLLRISSLPNGLEQERSSDYKLIEVEQKEEEGFSPSPVPSKEDSVTEEKEMEESKQESSDGGAVGSGSIQPKLNNSRLQPVSVPYGGARPKQPVSLKLQIPQPLSGQVQNQLVTKNKNLENQGRRLTPQETSLSGTDQTTVGVNGDDVVHSPSLMLSESPDNDLQAGHQGSLCKKPANSLGEVAPVWVPDSQAPVCMKCDVKFTFTKRRHHCRACGKVFCATCCSLKCRLMYMDRKEARVCVTCHSALMSAQSWDTPVSSSSHSPNPNNPAEYCSTIPPLQQAQASGVLSSPPPTVMVPVGVLKQPGNEASLTREQRRVWFADGVLPNGDTAESPKPPSSSPVPLQLPAISTSSNKSSTSGSSEAAHTPVAPVGSPVGSSLSLIPEDGLPPILISTGVKGDYAVEERPLEIVLMQQLEEGGPDPLVFVLNANLLAMVKLVNYVNRKCWYVTTKGMHAVGQAEVVILLQCLPDEKTIPKDIFTHFVHLYQEALSGNVLSHLSHSFFTQSFLGSKEHGGFLYISPSFQSLQDLLLPNPPYLFGILIQKWETPWAKVFPIRLMLRLGAEYRFYPCPLFSVRFRKPLFGETGHTIMNLLADFRNYQYTLPVVKGLVVDMEVRKTSIKIPSNRYNELMKAMNKSNEHVLAMGACFNDRADSHLVCVQNDDGNYQTQAISIHHQPRKVTGACFFVFSGALKASSGFLAKTSIVEDGVMIQITAETMDSLRQALRDMKDFTITCGKADQEENQELVQIQWTEDDHNFNKGVISPIDGKSMESITSVKIFHGSEFKANGKVIRWTEVFFLQSEDQPNGLSDPADHSRLTENVARAFCVALCPHLKLLKEDGMAKLGLRVTLDSDQVGYLAGSNGQPLLHQYLSDLDSALIPVIHSGACQLSEGPVVMELVFYILEIIS